MIRQRLHLNYIKGKQVICLIAIIFSVAGFILDAITYYSIYSNIQILVQSITVLLCTLAMVLYILNKNKYYAFTFGLLSYSVIINIVVTATIIHTFISFTKFSHANILSRDIFFIIVYIVLSGFILGRKHLVIQGSILLGLILYFVFILKDEFFISNAAIYLTATIVSLGVLYFFVGTLDQLIKDLQESNLRANVLKELETGKNRSLLKYQNALLELTKDESIFKKDIYNLFRTICAYAVQNLKTSRVSIWTLENDNAHLIRKHIYELSAGNDEQVTLVKKDFPLYFHALETKPFILANDASTHVDTKEFKDVYLKPLGIFSMLDCPIVIDGKPVGVICCENQYAYKNWSTEEVLFIQSLSGHISIFYKNLEINDLLIQIRNRNFELVEKSNEIETMNEELNSLNEELTTINESLEDTVVKRTYELETQNKQLTEYAFINSHILRAPLARILGLAQLISMSESTSVKDKQLLNALIHSSDELDAIIRKISDILYDGNNLSREDIQVIIDRTMNKN